ncbi:Sigma-54 dependent transcriptional regulator [Sorangium cellulosum So ce56]|uniref:Sigma-54 dependent transcriptional regulator n=2 Tax=Polyangiaceae TaxID=49 RepID=A9GV34_SORC5|nr:Sigma-54 dependent transcriptional regulator [Sorangium cellulosum So ce56]
MSVGSRYGLGGRCIVRWTARRRGAIGGDDRVPMLSDSTLEPADPSRRGLGPVLVPALTILGHPNLERVGERALLLEMATAHEAQLSRMEPVFAMPGRAPSALKDRHVSRTPLRLRYAGGGGISLCMGESTTHLVVDGEVLEGERELSPAEIARGVVLELSERVVLTLHIAMVAPPAGDGGDNLGLSVDTQAPPLSGRGPAGDGGDDLGLVGQCAALDRVRREIRAIAKGDMPVLILGETGTGKELVAQAIHRLSARRAEPFLAVNMASLSPSLASAELFGIKKGAFTGAVEDRRGYFGEARNGTLFLDEIGDTPPDVQVMLLRALETGEIQAVGSRTVERPHVRVLSATDANLQARIASGAFRAPLLHRLAGFEISLPPLRARREDIGCLFVHFLRDELMRVGQPDAWRASGPDGRGFVPASLIAQLARYDWPGNVRQLRNVVRQLVVSSRGALELRAGPHLDELLGRGAGAQRAGATPRLTIPAQPDRVRRSPKDVTEDELVATLRACRWDLKAAAYRLRLARSSLYELLNRCTRVRRAADLTHAEIAHAYRDCGGDIDAMVERLEVSRKSLSRRIRELKVPVRVAHR